MKQKLKLTLGTGAAVMIFILFNFHISSCTGSGSGSGNGSGNGVDSNGNNPTAKRYQTPINNKEFIIRTRQTIPAGSELLLECPPGVICNTAKLAVTSTDSNGTGGGGGPKLILQYSIPYDIPEATEFVIRIVHKGDSLNFERVDN
jgi:hypothetical protein